MKYNDSPVSFTKAQKDNIIHVVYAILLKTLLDGTINLNCLF